MRLTTDVPFRSTATGPRPFPDAGRIGVALVTALVLIGVVMLAFSMWTARQQMLHGSQELRLAASLRSSESPGKLSMRAQTRAHLVEAERAFASARADLHQWSPLISRLGWMPVIGGRLSAAAPAADAAFYASGAALHLVDGLGPLWPASGRAPSGHGQANRLVAALRAGRPEFEKAKRDADRAALALERVPRRSGDADLDRATARLRRDLPWLRQAGVWLALAPTLLGDRSPNRYLLVWENPAELRATGGFIGASDLITVRHGSWSHRFAGRVPPPREIDSVYLPLPEAAYTPETYWIFSDSNWSPDFPLSARLERWFYGEDTGLWADGVIDVVDTATPDLLRVTGPVYVPRYHRWITTANVEALAQAYINGASKYVNGSFTGPVQQGYQDTIRKQFFFAVLQALQRRVETLPLARWPSLAAALMRSIAHRDILLYDRRPAVESAILEAGAGGRILHPAGDYLYVVDDNRSYNKLNPYVHETARLTVSMAPDLRPDEVLTLHYSVAPSPSDLEGYGPDLGQWGTKHDYQDFLRVYVPRGARLEQMSGLDEWAPEQAYGLTQFAGRLLVRQGHSATVTIRYSLPANAIQAAFGSARTPRYRLTVQRQPGANLSSITVSIRGLDGLVVAASDRPGTSHIQRTLSLSQDAVLTLAIHGRIQPRPVALPPLPPQPDPYIPYMSFSDRRHPL